jgi:3-deoxy-D-manno-octulosonate 8-phosphate phosphatase (KDO 8-P phosphatase)
MNFENITTFVFDVDGVFTNNEIMITESGEYLRTMNVRDGMALKIAGEKGYQFAIITGGTSKGVVARFNKFGIQMIYSGVFEKKAALLEISEKLKIQKEEILYMGDDIPDIQVFPHVGIACCPFDAIDEIQKIADYISPFKGGQGCVRDVIEKVLRARKDWPV